MEVQGKWKIKVERLWKRVKIKQGRGSPIETLGAPLEKREEILAFCGLWEIESRAAAAVAVLGQGGGMQEVTNIQVLAL